MPKNKKKKDNNNRKNDKHKNKNGLFIYFSLLWESTEHEMNEMTPRKKKSLVLLFIFICFLNTK